MILSIAFKEFYNNLVSAWFVTTDELLNYQSDGEIRSVQEYKGWAAANPGKWGSAVLGRAGPRYRPLPAGRERPGQPVAFRAPDGGLTRQIQRRPAPGYARPSRRYRKEFTVAAFPEKTLLLSGMVLGKRAAVGVGVFQRAGVELNPRPSLRFRHGEKIAVYLEVYGLAVKDGRREFEVRVTVTRDEKTSLLAELLPFRDQKLERSLSMTFDRFPQHSRPDVP